jgi:hypothetical protein
MQKMSDLKFKFQIDVLGSTKTIVEGTMKSF